MVGKLIAQHTSKIDQTPVYDAPLFKLKGGGPHFLDSQGSWWTAAYINEDGNVVRESVSRWPRFLVWGSDLSGAILTIARGAGCRFGGSGGQRCG